ncbi:hypothetical protein DSUL_50092 [Desulfovibrionales bacterium]
MLRQSFGISAHFIPAVCFDHYIYYLNPLLLQRLQMLFWPYDIIFLKNTACSSLP